MEGWMHEIWDLFTIRETRPSIHRFKDSAAQFPFLGQYHRVINHNNWREYARALGLKATSANDVLNSGLAEKLLGIYAFMSAEQVPYLLQKAYVDAIVSISHEAWDDIWSQWDDDFKECFRYETALMAIEKRWWPDKIWNNDYFCRLQDRILWYILPGYYVALKDVPGQKERIEEVVDNYFRMRRVLTDEDGYRYLEKPDGKVLPLGKRMSTNLKPV